MAIAILTIEIIGAETNNLVIGPLKLYTVIRILKKHKQNSKYLLKKYVIIHCIL